MSITGDRIRELRIKNNLTLDDVAKRIGVGRQAVYKYEQGTVTNIPLENLEQMAALFNTSPGYLAGWSDEPPLDPNSGKPQTIEARIIADGVDQLPPDQREQALNVLRAVFSQHPELFKEERS